MYLLWAMPVLPSSLGSASPGGYQQCNQTEEDHAGVSQQDSNHRVHGKLLSW
jgi:hypothetical protein